MSTGAGRQKEPEHDRSAMLQEQRRPGTSSSPFSLLPSPLTRRFSSACQTCLPRSARRHAAEYANAGSLTKRPLQSNRTPQVAWLPTHRSLRTGRLVGEGQFHEGREPVRSGTISCGEAIAERRPSVLRAAIKIGAVAGGHRDRHGPASVPITPASADRSVRTSSSMAARPSVP